MPEKVTTQDACQLIQDDLMCILDEVIPTKMMDDVCQVVVDRFKELNDSLIDRIVDRYTVPGGGSQF